MPLQKSIFALLALAAVPALAPAAGQAHDAAPQVIEIHVKKFAYSPAEITLHKGQTYSLHITSDDVPHSLRIRQLGVNAIAKPGQFTDATVTPDQIGDFKGDCGVFCGLGHAKMAMAVHVVE